MINGVLPKIQLTVDLIVPHIFFGAISPVPQYIVGINILSTWQNPHTGFLIHGVKVFMVRNAKGITVPAA